VSDLPPEIPHVTIRNFAIAVLRWREREWCQLSRRACGWCVQAEVAERILTLLLQVVYVTMTMLFAVHVVATLVYRVVQRAWTQVVSSLPRGIGRGRGQ
jgi:hypothetical protein